MISHKYKCIYIHIPKVAGTSIITVLGDAELSTKKKWPFKADDYKFNPPAPHLRAADYIKYGHATRQQYDSYHKFSFVRNPWDRIVSEYKYRRHPRRYSFKKFIFENFPEPSWTDEYCHVIPQYDFLYGDDGKQLVDYVGKFENLQADFNLILAELKISGVTLPHVNRSLSLFRRENSIIEALRTIRGITSIKQKMNTYEKYTEYYDAETVDYVADIYKKDIEFFDYSFTE